MKEKDLVNIFNSFLSENNFLYANEIRMGLGIPDIMLVLGLRKKIPLFDNYFELKAYKHISEKKVTNLENLISSMNLPRKNVVRLLNELVLQKVIERDDKKLKLNKKINFTQGKTISIEVKVKDWRNGLLQAKRYLEFSDYSYLAISSKYIKNVDLQYAEAESIGVISISKNNIKEIISPSQSLFCNDLVKHISLSQLINKSNEQITYKRKFLNIS